MSIFSFPRTVIRVYASPWLKQKELLTLVCIDFFRTFVRITTKLLT